MLISFIFLVDFRPSLTSAPFIRKNKFSLPCSHFLSF